MSKVIKGKELFKMIAEGEIDENTKVTVDNYGECTLGFVFEDGRNLFKWIDEDFELIEDEIDINSIEEFEIDKNNFIQTELGAFKTRKMDIAFLDKINELVQAVKQLDRKINQ